MNITKNTVEEEYNLKHVYIRIDKKVIFRFRLVNLLSEYIIKVLSEDGSVKKYTLLAFSKNVANELLEDITKTKEGE